MKFNWPNIMFILVIAIFCGVTGFFVYKLWKPETPTATIDLSDISRYKSQAVGNNG